MESVEPIELATGYAWSLWSILVFNGFNVTISAYLTAIHLPIQSGLVALGRSLILPAGFLPILFKFVPQKSFIWAVPAAEFLTFILTFYLYFRHQPQHAMASKQPLKHDSPLMKIASSNKSYS